ncbi:MAG: TlyA family RNA methyltransferase [Candidatus Obscuribacterales bacterium]
MAKTDRLDALVLARGLFASREAARTAIMDGVVLVDGEKATKPGSAVRTDARIELAPGFAPLRYVSRGGLKLEKALRDFSVEPHNRVCVDIGASTGGFTDCLLQNGARRVYAVDVGYGQLDWALRNDSRVMVLERVNARYITRELLNDDVEISLAVIDVSFISLLKILPALKTVLTPDGDIVALVKPQFEAGKDKVGKGGVVRGRDAHQSILTDVIAGARASGFVAVQLSYSPVKGPKGNIEFLAHFKVAAAEEAKSKDAGAVLNAGTVVDAAHTALNRE